MHKISQDQFKSREEFDNALRQMFIDDANEYMRQRGNSPKFPVTQQDLYPILYDIFQPAGTLSAGMGYMLFDLTVAKWINRSGVRHVYDIGSRLDGFISHLLAMDIRVTMLDIRPLPYKIENLDFIQADAMNGLQELEDNSIEALSSLCVFEHFGLGRYGDPVDYDGWKKAIDGVKRKLAVGGRFYLEVPIGKNERVCFNAHRIFRPSTIVETATPELELERFSVIHAGQSSVKHYIFGGGANFVRDFATHRRDYGKIYRQLRRWNFRLQKNACIRKISSSKKSCLVEGYRFDENFNNRRARFSRFSGK